MIHAVDATVAAAVVAELPATSDMPSPLFCRTFLYAGCVRVCVCEWFAGIVEAKIEEKNSEKNEQHNACR